MKMKGKAILSAIILVSHLVSMVWYHSHPEGWSTDNKALASQVFFGFNFIVMGLAMLVIAFRSSRCYLQDEIVKFHGLFIVSLGVIYWLHYAKIVVSSSTQKFASMMLSILFIFIVILFSAWRHGLFKRKT